MKEANQSHLNTAYVIITLFVITFFILLAIISHLIYITIRKSKDNGQGMQFFLITTISAIVSFEITCVLIILVIFQMIDNERSMEHTQHSVHYPTFTTVHYFVAIMDTFGHLLVVLVFIARYQYTFRSGYFTASQSVIRILYIVLITLFVCSVYIIALIIAHEDPYHIIVAEIIWEVAVEIMCLFILYLFLSKLYHLLRMTLHSQCDKTLKGKDKQSQFLDDLTRTVKASIESSREKSRSHRDVLDHGEHTSPNKVTNAGAKDSTPNIPQITPTTSMRFSPKSSIRMTIDGSFVEPIAPMKLNPIDSTHVQNSPDRFMFKDHASLAALSENDVAIDIQYTKRLSLPLPLVLMHDFDEAKGCDHGELNHMSSFSKAIPALEDVANRNISQPSSPVRTSILQRKCTVGTPPESPEIGVQMPKTIPSSNSASRRSSFRTRLENTGASDLVYVMNKMSLLVLLAVLMSVISVIGNVFIETHLLITIESECLGCDVQFMWAQILPLLDIIITSFMMYLHFHFADRVYQILLGKLDILFLTACLSILKRVIHKPKDTAAN
eukprot:16282_1